MRRAHLERLALICPACRIGGRGDSPLELATIVREDDGGEIVEGALACRMPGCLREHPIIDGIPVVVADLMGWASHQLDAVLRRDDLSPFMTSLLGDAAGPGTNLDNERKNLSIYATAHYAGEFPAFVAQVIAVAGTPGAGLWLDLGCSVGAGTFRLAAAGAELAIGVDLSFAMLRIAERARRTGTARFETRRVGTVYDPREVAIERDPARTGFLCADVTALPVRDGAAAGALSINVVDCVPDPMGHLGELARVLASDGRAALSTPYDWTAGGTPYRAWLGGNSQRSMHHGSSEFVIRRALQIVELAIADERERVTWRLPVNDRSTMEYAAHVMKLVRP